MHDLNLRAEDGPATATWLSTARLLHADRVPLEAPASAAAGPRRPSVGACAWIAVRETIGLLIPGRWS